MAISGCLLPIGTYALIAALAVAMAASHVGYWPWPLFGYAATGFVCLCLLCALNLNFLTWLLVAIPVIFAIGILILGAIYRYLGTLEVPLVSVVWSSGGGGYNRGNESATGCGSGNKNDHNHSCNCSN